MRHGKDERMRGTAAQALLDRGWGKAKVEVITNAEGSYLDVLQGQICCWNSQSGDEKHHTSSCIIFNVN